MFNSIKLVTFNIDGLPETVDLKNLPWILKPISWVYKLIKGTTIIPINDNSNCSYRTTQISKYLDELYPDIIAVQEDFNFHNELMKSLDYNTGTYSGGFDISKIFSSIKWWPYPRLKADGLNILTKKDKIKINDEEIIPWNKSNGYVGHACDKLIEKGFRYYNVTVSDEYNLNIYIVHMDADFYHPIHCPDVSEDLKARKSQLGQLTDYIINKYNSGDTNPSIILGDTNSTDYYSWDIENIQLNLIHKINHENGLHIYEAKPELNNDVDRLFFINCDKSNIELKYTVSVYNTNLHLSDHNPLITEILIRPAVDN